uniref:Uncharacterized protein n=1 Tax=viral metagenome TaxID=1070528 RepID=A0A6C0CKQ2_9ZZZZ
MNKHAKLLKTLLGLNSDATDAMINDKHNEYKKYTDGLLLNHTIPHHAEISRFAHMGVTKMIQSYASLLNRNVDKEFLADDKQEYTNCLWEKEELLEENASLRSALTSCRELQREQYDAQGLSDLLTSAKQQIKRLKLQLQLMRRQSPNRTLLDIYEKERKVDGTDIVKYQHEVGQMLGKKDMEIAKLKEKLLDKQPGLSTEEQVDASENDDTKNLTRAKLVKNYTELVKDCGKHLPGEGDFRRRVMRIEAFGDNERSNIKTPFIRRIIKKGDQQKRTAYRAEFMPVPNKSHTK